MRIFPENSLINGSKSKFSVKSYSYGVVCFGSLNSDGGGVVIIGGLVGVVVVGNVKIAFYFCLQINIVIHLLCIY